MKKLLCLASLVLAACAEADEPPNSRGLSEALSRAEVSFSVDGAFAQSRKIDVPSNAATREIRSTGCTKAKPYVYSCNFTLILYDPANAASGEGILAAGTGRFQKVGTTWKGLQDEYKLQLKSRVIQVPAQ